ncbi:RNA polymerase sigma factor [Haloferula helveola]|uniref:RNA polymerase sigma factor n=1 Tax=Haloferula helveola TaxID=490095 RepID=A0ABN6HC76_9BACT|nr:RNA polymerase sigma factor [Haloferula helveola]
MSPTPRKPLRPEDFNDLVREHEGWIRGFFRARVRDWTAADDLAQDVFVTAYRGLRKFRGDSSVGTWLRGIAVNHLRNFIRKRREQCIGGSEELQLLMDPVEARESERHEGGRLDALRECLSRVDGPARQLLQQRYVVGQTVRELASESGRGYSALTMQLHRLRESLAECVKKQTRSSLS